MTARPPLVALVGRPNVGKSTLFNRLVGERAALVHNRPGVTRDRVFGELRWQDRLVRLVDTGGFDTGGDPLMAQVREQTRLAIDEADLVLLILDGVGGLAAADREVAQLLRRAGKPTIAIANKLDEPMHDAGIAELYELGIDPILPVSAEHGRGVGELCDVLLYTVSAPLAEVFDAAAQPLPVEGELEEGEATRVEWQGGPVRIAVIGRPNAGKSSLVNELLGEERFLATPVPGTTRDAVDAELEVDGQTFVLVDTAGIRRKRSIADQIERYAVMAAVRSIDSADVALVVLDASEEPAEQDAKIAALAHERGKGVLLVANKWDLVGSEAAGRELVERIRYRLPFLSYAKLLRVSAKTGRGLRRLLPSAVDVQRERHRRVGTADLNRFFESVVERHPPPIRKGRRPRLYYVSQPLVRPPTFVFAASNPQAVRGSYERYLTNELRKRYGFESTPIWIKFRQRGKKR
jgi:GTP-binding protein